MALSCLATAARRHRRRLRSAHLLTTRIDVPPVPRLVNPADVVTTGPLFLISNPTSWGWAVAGFGLLTALLRLPPSFRRQCRTPAGRLAGWHSFVLVALARLTRLVASLADTGTNTSTSTNTNLSTSTSTSTAGGHGGQRGNVPTVRAGCWSSLPSAWAVTISTTWTWVTVGHGDMGTWAFQHQHPSISRQ